MVHLNQLPVEYFAPTIVRVALRLHYRLRLRLNQHHNLLFQGFLATLCLWLVLGLLLQPKAFSGGTMLGTLARWFIRWLTKPVPDSLVFTFSGAIRGCVVATPRS